VDIYILYSFDHNFGHADMHRNHLCIPGVSIYFPRFYLNFLTFIFIYLSLFLDFLYFSLIILSTQTLYDTICSHLLSAVFSYYCASFHTIPF